MTAANRMISSSGGRLLVNERDLIRQDEESELGLIRSSTDKLDVMGKKGEVAQ